jgi:hypothetical protein
MDPKTKLVVLLDDSKEPSVIALIASPGANLHMAPRLREIVEAAVGWAGHDVWQEEDHSAVIQGGGNKRFLLLLEKWNYL